MGHAPQNKIIIYVFSKRYDEYESRLRSIGFAQEILREIKKVSNREFAVGIGGIKDNSLLMDSYEEARKALRKASSEVIHYSDVPAKDEEKSLTVHDDWKLLNSLELGDADVVEEIIESIFDKQDVGGLTESRRFSNRNKLIELMVVAHRLALELNVEEDEKLNFSTYLNEILDISDPQEFKAWYKTRLINLAMRIQKVREANSSRIIHDAKQYIENRYTSDISLESTAKELGISPHYLSKLFKKETKVNFIDYLTRLRLTKAKDLMKEGGKSIKEICYMVGYTDPNYFSRIFKKHTDHSPSEFIKGV
jgi:two-component system response regulator YesN